MNLIVNVTPDWGIGCGNHLLVALPSDLRRFRELTSGKVVILGRKTLATFPGGRPLKNRVNVVLSTNPEFACEGAVVVRSQAELLEKLRGYPREDLCVIGGASIYAMLLAYCDTAQITKTYANLDADRFLPDLDKLPNWEIRKVSELHTENGMQFQYIDYVNLTPRKL